MVDIKDVANTATEYFKNLYGCPYSDLALEEVELSSDENHWMITLGFTPPLSGLNALAGSTARREYKKFIVDAETGDVKSMKIRIIDAS